MTKHEQSAQARKTKEQSEQEHEALVEKLSVESAPEHEALVAKLSAGSEQAPAQLDALVIALDTASDAIALAVGKCVAQGNEHRIELLASGDTLARREANIRLVPALDNLFTQQGLDKGKIACVVCGRGPGSFTGVRIAVATAKGLAAGLGVPLFGVAPPDALAWQAWLQGTRGQLAVLSDAMRGEVYPARYTLNEVGAHRDDPLTVIKAEVLAQKWQGSEEALLLTGDALYKYGELFSGYTWLEEQCWRPTGEGLLKAFDAAPKGDGNITSLLPVYTRLSDAEENERRRLAEGGALAQGALTEVPASGVAWPQNPDKRVFRPAAAGDIPAMVALEQTAYAHANSILSGECWTAPLYRADIGLSSRSWWVCYQDNVLVGFIGGQVLDGQMHILDVVVHESSRRQGIAWHLLMHVVQDAVDLGATEVTLEVRASNSAAQALYKNVGLEEVGRRKAYYSPLQSGKTREDALIMTGSVDAAVAQRISCVRPKNSGESAQEPFCLSEARQTLVLNETSQSSCSDGVDQKPFSDKHPLILAIESSCDETAAALIDGQGRLLQNIVASQTDFHSRFGGVVPEIASRKHTEAIYPVVMEALGEHSWHDLDAIAVTYAPGLIGALVVGMAFAKGLSWATGLPLIKVNHLEGHIYANRFTQRFDKLPTNAEATGASREATAGASQVSARIEANASLGGVQNSQGSPSNAKTLQSSQRGLGTSSFYQIDPLLLQPPFIVALLSGGNTLLVHVRKWGEYVVLGQTLDDAVGEAYDKVAKALGLGYPGGPLIARLAEQGNPKAVSFPRALLHSGNYQFSLSGLKTAVITEIRKQATAGTLSLPDIAASFERAVIEVQVAKALKACQSLGVSTFCIGGGVAANKALREAYKEAMEPHGIYVLFPPELACTDNAAMIAAVALDRFALGKLANLSDDALAHADIELEY